MDKNVAKGVATTAKGVGGGAIVLGGSRKNQTSHISKPAVVSFIALTKSNVHVIASSHLTVNCKPHSAAIVVPPHVPQRKTPTTTSSAQPAKVEEIVEEEPEPEMDPAEKLLKLKQVRACSCATQR